MNRTNLKITLFIFFLVGTCSLIIFSCQKENVIEKSVDKPENYFVDNEDACMYSDKIFSSAVFKSLKSANLNSQTTLKTVKEIIPVPDNNKLTAYYIINYDQGGVVILSADKRFIPIFAYSKEGSMPLVPEDYNPSLASWLLLVKENIESVRKSNISATKEIQNQWANLSNENIEYLKLKNAVPGDSCTDTYEQVGPLLSTVWNQGCGFNSLLPTKSHIAGCVNVNMECGQAYAGCAAIAMGQVMKFYQRPTSYNWSLMPNTSGSTTTASLIKDIDDALPANYTCTGTTAYPNQVVSTFINRFGYHSAILASYNHTTVISNLRLNRPVILGGTTNGEGHSWVCDGFYDSYQCLFDGSGHAIGAYNYVYLHMVWGNMYADGDGWYAFDNFNPTVKGTVENYNNSDRQMVYNIIP